MREKLENFTLSRFLSRAEIRSLLMGLQVLGVEWLNFLLGACARRGRGRGGSPMEPMLKKKKKLLLRFFNFRKRGGGFFFIWFFFFFFLFGSF